jgi:hypothetical protein
MREHKLVGQVLLNETFGLPTYERLLSTHSAIGASHDHDRSCVCSSRLGNKGSHYQVLEQEHMLRLLIPTMTNLVRRHVGGYKDIGLLEVTLDGLSPFPMMGQLDNVVIHRLRLMDHAHGLRDSTIHWNDSGTS